MILANRMTSIVWAHGGNDPAVKACTNYAEAAQGWLSTNLPQILKAMGLDTKPFLAPDSLKKFTDLMNALAAKGRRSADTSMAKLLGADFSQVQDSAKALSPEDRALIESLIQKNELQQRVIAGLGTVEQGKATDSTRAEITALHGQVAKLADVISQLRNPTPENKEAAVRAVRELEPGIGLGTVIAVGAGALGFGAIIFALARS